MGMLVMDLCSTGSGAMGNVVQIKGISLWACRVVGMESHAMVLGYLGIGLYRATGVKGIWVYILSANHTANGASSIYPYLGTQLMSQALGPRE